MASLQDATKKGKYQGFVDAIPRYFANNLHQLLLT